MKNNRFCYTCPKCAWTSDIEENPFGIKNECPDCKNMLRFVSWDSPREDNEAEQLIGKQVTA